MNLWYQLHTGIEGKNIARYRSENIYKLCLLYVRCSKKFLFMTRCAVELRKNKTEKKLRKKMKKGEERTKEKKKKP